MLFLKQEVISLIYDGKGGKNTYVTYTVTIQVHVTCVYHASKHVYYTLGLTHVNNNVTSYSFT